MKNEEILEIRKYNAEFNKLKNMLTSYEINKNSIGRKYLKNIYNNSVDYNEDSVKAFNFAFLWTCAVNNKSNLKLSVLDNKNIAVYDNDIEYAFNDDMKIKYYLFMNSVKNQLEDNNKIEQGQILDDINIDLYKHNDEIVDNMFFSNKTTNVVKNYCESILSKNKQININSHNGDFTSYLQRYNAGKMMKVKK